MLTKVSSSAFDATAKEFRSCVFILFYLNFTILYTIHIYSLFYISTYFNTYQPISIHINSIIESTVTKLETPGSSEPLFNSLVHIQSSILCFEFKQDLDSSRVWKSSVLI